MRAEWIAIASWSGAAESSSSSIALGATFHTSSNHSMNTSRRARAARSLGKRAGSGRLASRWRRMRRESATTTPSSSSTGTKPCPDTSSTGVRSA